MGFLHKFLNSRLTLIGLVFTAMFLFLTVRLYQLQIVRGKEYLNDYLQMTSKEIVTPGYRGTIYDRNGNVLAGNELAYIVTVQDNGQYREAAEKNAMLLRLVRILNRHGYEAVGKFEIAMEEDGSLYYTTTSETSRKRFLCDVYGLRTADQLTGDAGDYPAGISAEKLFEDRFDHYRLDGLKSKDGGPERMTKREALQIINIRYTMGLTAYRKYEATQVSSYIDEGTMAAILESAADLEGVNVERTTIRRYYDSTCFAPIIGYVGKASEEQLKQLREEYPQAEYELNDIVGRTGIEASMEHVLQGKKGKMQIGVDNVGHILEVFCSTEAEAGQDVYLTLDRDLQKNVYGLVERHLAEIVASKLADQEASVNENKTGSTRVIPIRTAYFQLIANQVLSTGDLQREEASAAERQIRGRFEEGKARILKTIRSELESEGARSVGELPGDVAACMGYMVSYLSQQGQGVIRTRDIDPESRGCQNWRDRTGSLRGYLLAGLEDGWIDTGKLEMEKPYYDLEEAYASLVEYALAQLERDTGFEREIYRQLIEKGDITGCQLCLALCGQGVVTGEEAEIQQLRQGDERSAYEFLKKKIAGLELTPAQMALEPCTASVVVTDVHTGKVLALVSYPGYDNNRLSGTMDVDYYNRLLADQSNPLYNSATQTLKAPGSTFKPVTAIAALEEGVITPGEEVVCTGLYDQVANPIKCWIYPGQHGGKTMREGIQDSCNYYFAELGHRLSIGEDGAYEAERGIERIREYAALFGLDQVSGVEIPEAAPHLTTQDPERSAMGQATHAYANVQLARYVTALANRGTVYQLSLIGRAGGECDPVVQRQLDFAETTWDTVQAGMRGVITDNPTRSVREMFGRLEIPIAGKTGTAQESKSHANHAFFISYGPYENPEISVSVCIPYGYSSGNAAALAMDVYRLYFGDRRAP